MGAREAPRARLVAMTALEGLWAAGGGGTPCPCHGEQGKAAWSTLALAAGVGAVPSTVPFPALSLVCHLDNACRVVMFVCLFVWG